MNSTRQFAWIGLVGLLCAGLAFAAGRLYELWRLGPNDHAALDRVETEVRRAFDERVASIRTVATALSTSPAIIATLEARRDDNRPVFDELTRVVGPAAPPDLSITVYNANNVPRGWYGRPSDVPAQRQAEPDSYFVALSSFGWRLAFVQPIFARADPGHPRRRIGAVAAERVLVASHGVERPSDPRFEFATSLVTVQMWPRFVGAVELPGAPGFTLSSPTGEPVLEARVDPGALEAFRQAYRRTALAWSAAIIALTLVVLAIRLATFRHGQPRSVRRYVLATAALVALLVAAQGIAKLAPPDAWSRFSMFDGEAYRGAGLWFLGSPFDLVLTSLLTLGLVATGADSLRRLRIGLRWWRRGPSASWQRTMAFVLCQLAAGIVVALLLTRSMWVLDRVVEHSPVKVFQFSLLPWNGARLASLIALLTLHAAVFWTAVVVCRVGLLPWRVNRATVLWRVGAACLWGAGAATAITLGWFGAYHLSKPALLANVLAAGTVAWFARAALTSFAHGTQAWRLMLLFGAAWLPGLLLYPAMAQSADRAARALVETQYSVQVMNHPQELRARLQDAMRTIDSLAARPEGIEPLETVTTPPRTDLAFTLWRETSLAAFRLTSALELYGASGRLVSRFALNFPEYALVAQRWTARSCQWEVFGETTAFGSGERRMLHAERGLCAGDPKGPPGDRRVVGGIVIHVMLDYPALPFISPQDPYSEFFRTGRTATGPEIIGPEVILLVYGWGRSPVYTSTERAWPLDDAVFARIYASRTPFWTTISIGDVRYDVFFANDRTGIYAVGYATRTWFDAGVDIAELTVLVGLVFFVAFFAMGAVRVLAGTSDLPGRALVREIRQSFYRKLFLAFVAAAIVPVLTLAVVVRTYVAGRLRADIEAEAARTAAVAQRVIEESLLLQQAGTGPPVITDDVMISIGRLIEQDVNIFEGPTLKATSERDLFASGLLPTRTPADVYRAINVQRLPNYVGEDVIGDFRYLTAAAPVRVEARDVVLTVPLALRQREIERKIDDLDRGVTFGALVFVLLGAGIGFWMAERIGDPVTRLTHATERIAAGDLDARVLVKSADELERLVEAFNRMAQELKHQRVRLERTNRLEAWAEMARQVAHDIKNPLTPIQLSAEHLRRVHQDLGRPLDGVLDSCVDTILAQVRLLRQLSSEFSSFASSPTARLEMMPLGAVVTEVVDAYRPALEPRVRFDLDLADDLPLLALDRTLLGRALTNVIENALHAMPGGGTLRIAAQIVEGSATLSVSDTGVGMDRTALGRIFEPYFSTKATGTGLGLTIAKRNIELLGGSIGVRSALERGTTVTITLPVRAVEETAPPRAVHPAAL